MKITAGQVENGAGTVDRVNSGRRQMVMEEANQGAGPDPDNQNALRLVIEQQRRHHVPGVGERQLMRGSNEH